MEEIKSERRHEKRMKNVFGNVAFIALAFASFVLFASLASADSYSIYCLERGQSINLAELCNPRMRTMQGPITLCMHLLDNGKICPTNLNTCNNLGLSCESNMQNTSVDGIPPILNVSSPQNVEIYDDKSILVDLTTNELSSITYLDNSRQGGWKPLCSRCMVYSQRKTFSEGENNITFKAVDGSGNTAFFDVFFYVDSKAPKIVKTEPTRGFASGEFNVIFQEDNPTELKIEYGNEQTGLRNKTIDIQTECLKEGSEYRCMTNIDLADYDGEEIGYHAILTDVAGSVAFGKHTLLDVDNSIPVINSLNYTINGKDVTFVINVTEPFLEEITLIDNADARARESVLCTRLTNRVCTKKVSFKDGERNVTIFVRDQAGNVASIQAEFFIDSKKPKIKKTEPTRGFASGLFEVEFEEENPSLLVLSYGTDAMIDVALDLGSDCTFSGRKTNCAREIDLSSFDGQEISYKFTLADRAGQTDSSRPIALQVDTTEPVINGEINYSVRGRSAEIVINITEANFADVVYTNEADSRPREKTLCTRLRNGICTGRISLNLGTNTINFQVNDKAGNSVGRSLEITI